MNKYGLRDKKTGKIAGFHEVSNGKKAEFCNETTTTLGLDEANVWLVDDPQQAEWVRCNPTKWSNSNYETPAHTFKLDNLETIKIHMIVETIDVELPSIIEVYEKIYQSNPSDWKRIKNLIESGYYENYRWKDFIEYRTKSALPIKESEEDKSPEEDISKPESIRQLHFKNETIEQEEQLDREFEKLDIKYFNEMELIINYVRIKLGQSDFSYLGKCTEIKRTLRYILPTLSKNSIEKIVKELQRRSPELWPREANNVLLLPQMNKLISFISAWKV